MTESTAPVALPLSSIRAGQNPRRYFNQRSHDELVTSLRLRGMLQPMLVRPATDDGAYLIVTGGRRYRAAIEAFGEEASVPVLIREMTDQEALEAAIDENDVRDDASETEQADAAVRVLAACQDDRAEAARRLGWSPAKLDRRLALANLSDPVKLALDERRIKVGHAELLAAVPGDKQDRALETILSAALDVNKTRELLMRVTQSLAAARFDKDECTACPFNSAAQRALFATHVEDGYCTNPGCFQLKTEAAEKAQQETETKHLPKSGAAGGEKTSAAVPSDARRSTPDSSHGAQPRQGSTPAKPKVTVQGLADKLRTCREAAWRTAVAAAITDSADHLRVADLAASYVTSEGPMAFSTVDALAIELEVDLRATWKVDGNFLAQLSKEELKFVAQECGLVAHLGEKAFAKRLAAPASDLITGMLHVTGFDWAGRLPSAMTINGRYGPPPVDDSVVTPSTKEKDASPC